MNETPTDFGRDQRRGRRHHGNPWQGRRGRGRRQGRGDVRLALLFLIDEEPRHGYELMQAIGERSGGMWQPSPGSVYPALQQLQDEGLIRVEVDDQNRGIANLTDAGTAYVTDHRAELDSVWTSLADQVGSGMDVRHKVHGLILALKQINAVGTPSQIREAGEVIDETQRSLYAILAQAPADEEA